MQQAAENAPIGPQWPSQPFQQLMQVDSFLSGMGTNRLGLKAQIDLDLNRRR
jgi:hypothetical protein